jgi:hypothetical protein
VSDEATTVSEDERELATEIVRRALARAAPEEVLLLDDVAAEFFADPEKSLTSDGRDEAVGFGLDLAMVAPAMLAMALVAVRTLGTVVTNAVEQEGTPVVRQGLRRLLGLDERSGTQPVPAPVPLSTEELRRVRGAAFERARALGLTTDQASLLADAIAGGLATEP